MSPAYTVILVYATSHAIKVEKMLQRVEINSKLIPVPRHLSSDCGVCVRIEQVDREQAKILLESAQMSTEGYYDI